MEKEIINNRLGMVKRNLKECLNENILKECLNNSGTFHVYWGTAPTGRPHIAYFLPITKLADYLTSGNEVTILFANLHAFLDNMKAPWELLDKRTEYYEIIITGLLKAINVKLDKLKFIRGTDFQLNENYTASVYKIANITSVRNAIKAGTDVVKQNSDPVITSLIYPLLQGLDEEFLNVDAQFGGLDQRKIFTYASKHLPILGFSKRAHLMNPMIPGLTGSKMSASDEQSKIDLLDDLQTIEKKLESTLLISSENNEILKFIKNSIWPHKSDLNIVELNSIETYEEMELQFQNDQLTEDMIKDIVKKVLYSISLNPKIQIYFKEVNVVKNLLNSDEKDIFKLSSKSNGLLAFLKYVIWPNKSYLNIEQLNQFISYDELELNLQTKKVDKESVLEIVKISLSKLLSNLKNEFISNGKESLINEAYPEVTLQNCEDRDSKNKILSEFLNKFKYPRYVKDINCEEKMLSDFPDQFNSLCTEFPEVCNMPIEKFPKISCQPTIMWSCRTNGEPHFGYLVPLRKLAILSNRGWKIIILLEDIGEFLFSNKLTWDMLENQSDLYRKVIKNTFSVLEGNEKELTIISGLEFQLKREYSLLMYQFLAHVTLNESKKMLAQFLDQEINMDSTKLSSLLYPCMSVINQIFLKATVRLFGDFKYVDEFEWFMKRYDNCEQPFMPVFLKHKLIQSLKTNTHMKKSLKQSKDDHTMISLLDEPHIIKEKIKKSFLDPKDINNFSSLNILQNIIFPFKALSEFEVTRKQENGGNIKFSSLEEIIQSLSNNLLHPEDLKFTVAQFINDQIILPIQNKLGSEMKHFRFEIPSIVKDAKHSIKSKYNPNNLDIRVGKVLSVEFSKRNFEISLKIENDKFTLNSQICHSLTPNDFCLLAMTPSTNKNICAVIGVLSIHQAGKSFTEAIKLKTMPCLNALSFKNHDSVVPHLKEIKELYIIDHIEENFVLKNGKIYYSKDNSVAVVNTVYNNDIPAKILVKF